MYWSQWHWASAPEISDFGLFWANVDWYNKSKYKDFFTHQWFIFQKNIMGQFFICKNTKPGRGGCRGRFGKSFLWGVKNMTDMRYAWTTWNIPQTSIFLSLKSFWRKFVSMHHNTCGWWWSKHRHLFWDLVIQPFWSFEVLHLFIVVKTDIMHTVVVQRTISKICKSYSVIQRDCVF